MLPTGFEYFPVGYHGRTSTVVSSETPIVRPRGQYRDATGSVVFGPTKRLDYELEIAAVIGKASVLGEPVKIEEADEYIFGLVLLNDWSGKFACATLTLRMTTRSAIVKADKISP